MTKRKRKPAITPFNSLVGLNLTAIRKRKALSQALVGKVLGVHQSAVSRIEAGEQKLTLEEAKKLCRFLHIEMFDLTEEDQS